jgi:two-component system sensor histidine kinase PilS (NtrC family)
MALKSRIVAEVAVEKDIFHLMNKGESSGGACHNGSGSIKALGSHRANEPLALIGGLSAALVHDLRNPIATISTGAELLMSMNVACPQSRRLALNIYRGSARVERLVQELVSVACGSLEESESCNLAEVVDSAFECIVDAAESQRVHVEILLPVGFS